MVSFVICSFLFCLCRCDCGGSGTTQVGNSSPTDPIVTVTISKISEDDSLTIYIPLSVIGTNTSSLVETTNDIVINGEEYASDLTALTYYDSANEQVTLEVLNMVDGDQIVITINKPDDTFETYAATASTASDATAILTDSGVIQNEAVPEPEPDPDTYTAASTLVATLCAEITACVPELSEFVCLIGVGIAPNLSGYFGVDGADAALSLAELETAINEGTYTANEDNLAQCVVDLEAITCAEIIGAYSLDDPVNFEGLTNLIPTDPASCPDVF
ncbi:MAG: hypothetical protein ACD_62C00357G0002 [uncultured bacterium]|nr:MAG: hypothetical protein ACD_62C00357G0002 [uncultured bacterium]HLD44324.1 hypothetical protein [bacterium]